MYVSNANSNQTSNCSALGSSGATAAQRRKSRAENMSPVGGELKKKISMLKSETEKLNYMNKSRQSPLRSERKDQDSNVKSLTIQKQPPTDAS